MIFAFASEKSAEDFARLCEERYELEAEIGSYLHVEVPAEELGSDELVMLQSDAEEFGADDVLL
jgi:hypothetical protein